MKAQIGRGRPIPRQSQATESARRAFLIVLARSAPYKTNEHPPSGAKAAAAVTTGSTRAYVQNCGVHIPLIVYIGDECLEKSDYIYSTGARGKGVTGVKREGRDRTVVSHRM